MQASQSQRLMNVGTCNGFYFFGIHLFHTFGHWSLSATLRSTSLSYTVPQVALELLVLLRARSGFQSAVSLHHVKGFHCAKTLYSVSTRYRTYATAWR